ncbi:hypothetical protein GS534_00470 [Rhodococcus hoagii]|uniref:hypothetical protein n=1 Tax=Rhodococcus hoagii TaxID=43767 RepID=UPI001A0DF53E|nr:hypothetical protein [Prescottella equi]NKS29204.1 hypothetical protein [Prescottella equi]
MTTLNQFLSSIELIGVDDNNGLPGVLYSFQMNQRDGRLEMRKGEKGEKGDQGEPAYPFEWQGDMTNQQAIDNLLLGPDQKGWAYRNVETNAMHYWAGVGWVVFANAFGAPGPRGLANNLTIGTITTLPTGAAATASITGTPPNQVLNLGLPRGPQGVDGPRGAAAAIRDAFDYDNSVAPQHGDLIAWNNTANKWRPVRNPGVRGPYSIGPGSFPGVTNSQTIDGKTLTTMAIPAQDVAWRPLVQGGVETITNQTNNSSRVDVEVRLGSATGQIVGVGTGMPYQRWYTNRIQPYFDATMTPTSSVAVVPAGMATTLYVTIGRPFGTATYGHTNLRASLTCYCVPVPG